MFSSPLKPSQIARSITQDGSRILTFLLEGKTPSKSRTIQLYITANWDIWVILYEERPRLTYLGYHTYLATITVPYDI